MKILGNSSRGLNPLQKCLLYRSCALLIALYGFQLWYLPQSPSIVSSEDLGETSKESSHLDIRNIQNISFIQHQSNYRAYLYSFAPIET